MLDKASDTCSFVALRASLLFLLALLLPGCGGGLPGQEAPGSITEGVWVMEAGPDLFLWEFSSSEGGLGCRVHALQGGVYLNETPCRTCSSPNDLWTSWATIRFSG